MNGEDDGDNGEVLQKFLDPSNKRVYVWNPEARPPTYTSTQQCGDAVDRSDTKRNASSSQAPAFDGEADGFNTLTLGHGENAGAWPCRRQPDAAEGDLNHSQFCFASREFYVKLFTQYDHSSADMDNRDFIKPLLGGSKGFCIEMRDNSNEEWKRVCFGWNSLCMYHTPHNDSHNETTDGTPYCRRQEAAVNGAFYAPYAVPYSVVAYKLPTIRELQNNVFQLQRPTGTGADVNYQRYEAADDTFQFQSSFQFFSRLRSLFSAGVTHRLLVSHHEFSSTVGNEPYVTRAPVIKHGKWMYGTAYEVFVPYFFLTKSLAVTGTEHASGDGYELECDDGFYGGGYVECREDSGAWNWYWSPSYRDTRQAQRISLDTNRQLCRFCGGASLKLKPPTADDGDTRTPGTDAELNASYRLNAEGIQQTGDYREQYFRRNGFLNLRPFLGRCDAGSGNE